MLLCGCAGIKEPPKSESVASPEDSAPQLVGRIASIRERPRFVLIQSYGPWLVPAETILTSRGPDGRVANLLATGESTGQYAAADIRAGEVEIGDAVYTLPGSQPSSSDSLDAGLPTSDDGAEPAADEGTEPP
jgi:hypothetical protein